MIISPAPPNKLCGINEKTFYSRGNFLFPMTRKTLCIHIETRNEAEVKRVKYILKGIAQQQGMTFFMDEGEADVNHIANLLMAKTSPDRVHIYSVRKEDFQPDEAERRISEVFEGNKESTAKIERFLVSKRKGILQETLAGGAKRYNIYTKKGNVEITTRIKERNDNHCTLAIRVRGFRDAVDIIYQDFRKELEFFK